MDLIRCYTCDSLKPQEAFYALGTRKGFASVCKACAKKAAKERQDSTVKEIKEFMDCVLCKKTKHRKEFHESRLRSANRQICLPCGIQYAKDHGINIESGKYRFPETFIIDGHKVCSGCEENLPVAEFPTNKSAPSQLDWKCRKCKKEVRDNYLNSPVGQNLYWKIRLHNRHIYGDLSIAFVRNLYESHQYCEYCKVDFADPREAFFEHRIARAKGGPTTPENVTFACDQCNRAKNDMAEAEFLEWQKAYAVRLAAKFAAPSGQELELASFGDAVNKPGSIQQRSA